MYIYMYIYICVYIYTSWPDPNDPCIPWQGDNSDARSFRFSTAVAASRGVCVLLAWARRPRGKHQWTMTQWPINITCR